MLSMIDWIATGGEPTLDNKPRIKRDSIKVNTWNDQEEAKIRNKQKRPHSH